MRNMIGHHLLAGPPKDPIPPSNQPHFRGFHIDLPVCWRKCRKIADPTWWMRFFVLYPPTNHPSSVTMKMNKRHQARPFVCLSVCYLCSCIIGKGQSYSYSSSKQEYSRFLFITYSLTSITITAMGSSSHLYGYIFTAWCSPLIFVYRCLIGRADSFPIDPSC